MTIRGRFAFALVTCLATLTLGGAASQAFAQSGPVGGSSTGQAEAATEPSVRATVSKRKQKVRIKVSVRNTARLNVTQPVRAKAKGPTRKLRGSKFELRVKENGIWRKLDRAGIRFGKRRAARLSWVPTGEGLAKVRVVAIRGGRIIGASTTRGVFIVHPIKVLEPGQILSVPPAGESGTVTYAGSQGATPGDIVATGVGPSTPNGFLGMVTAVQPEQGGLTTVETKPTTLLATLPRGQIDVDVDYGSPETLRFDGNTRVFRPLRPVPLRSQLECSSGATLKVSGSATITPRISFDADWGWFSVKSAQFEASMNVEAQLSASAEARADCIVEPVPIARYPLPVITFSVGPVPVVITPQVVIYLQANGAVSARVSTGISASALASAGVRYENGAFSPIGDVGTDFEYEPPALSNTANLSGSVSPTLEMLIYGVGGPAAFVQAGLDLSAERGTDPWWTLTAPVRAGARLTAPVLDLSSGDLTVYEDRFELASAGSETDAPPEVQRAIITWDTDGSDVDLHVWDQSGNHAWYQDQEGIEDGLLSSDITTGYGPEVFSDTSGTGRKLTYGLCYYADNAAGPTTVTMDITDPNGTVRTEKRTLSGTGSYTIVGRSPEGSGYSPPSGWCGE